jgi:hypothetical protein
VSLKEKALEKHTINAVKNCDTYVEPSTSNKKWSPIYSGFNENLKKYEIG